MKAFAFLETYLLPHRVHDEEENRMAVIACVIGVAASAGWGILLIYRLLAGQFHVATPFALLGSGLLASLVLLRRGHTGWAGGLLTLSLLSFLEVTIWQNDGLNDTAMVALPGVLVVAGLVLKRRYFTLVTLATLSSVAALGYFELTGIARGAWASKVTTRDVIDLLVILSVTAITVRSLSDALTKSIVSITRNEREMMEQATLLRASEDRLRKSEEYYRTLVETSPEAIVIVDMAGRLVFGSKKAHELFGVPRSESIAGRSLFHWVALADHSTVENRLRGGPAKEAKPYSREYRLLKEDRTEFWGEIASSPLLDSGGQPTGLLLVCHDVTERRQAEELLRSSEQQYRSLFENANDAIFIFDPATEDILEANPKACELYGLPRDMFVGRSLHDSSLNASWGADVIRRTLESGQLKNFETTYSRAGNPTVHFLVNASVIDYRGKKAILSISRDLTYRKSAENQLSFLSAAVQQSPASIVLTDVSGAIEYVNPRFTDLTGYSPEEVKGKNPNVLKSGETPAREYRQLWSTILTGGEWHGEFHNRKKDGTLYWESATISPVMTGGMITHFLAIKEDITARKEMEERLRQMQKMESIGIMAGGIAHDFNNILTIILGHLSLVEIRKREPAAIGRSLAAMNEAVQRGASLVNQILTFARKSDTILEPVSVNRAIQDLVKMLHETFPRTIEIQLDLEKGLPMILMDHTQLHQALLNLCVNARDALVESTKDRTIAGILRISTGLVRGTSVFLPDAEARAADYVFITVNDSGAGMDEETRQRVFEPFFTTKKAGKGTGLGLSVVYGVVKSHRGLIDVQSRSGEGTTFTMYLPVPEHPEDAKKLATVGAPEIRGGNETILIVEDELAIASLMDKVLSERGYRVVTAHDGLQGLEIYSARKNEIALVLTDMDLPKLDGGSLYARVLELDPGAKVIIASGYIEPAQREALTRAGASAIIAKPYTPETILGTIRNVLDGIPE